MSLEPFLNNSKLKYVNDIIFKISPNLTPYFKIYIGN